jgi:DNA-directed RNA polymerase specialized sigma24 family protein
MTCNLKCGGKLGGRKKQRIGRDEFIAVWNAAQSLDEVASLTGLAKGSATYNASVLRDLGVQLKRMPRPSPPRRLLDIFGVKLSREEIAELLGITSGAVAGRIFSKRPVLALSGRRSAT